MLKFVNSASRLSLDKAANEFISLYEQRNSSTPMVEKYLNFKFCKKEWKWKRKCRTTSLAWPEEGLVPMELYQQSKGDSMPEVWSGESSCQRSTVNAVRLMQGKKPETILSKTQVAWRSPLRRLILKWHMQLANVWFSTGDSFSKTSNSTTASPFTVARLELETQTRETQSYPTNFSGNMPGRNLHSTF